MVTAVSDRNKGFFKLGCTGLLFAALSVFSTNSFAERQGMQSIHFRNIIDLSHTITTEIPLWPGDPPVEFTPLADFETDGYYLRSFSIGEHSATHMNAPNSFHANGIGIDQYQPASLVRPIVVIDVRGKVRYNDNYVISTQDVLQWERRHGRIKPGTLVLFHTGWQTRWHDPDSFINGMNFPGVGAATTKFMLEERHIAGVGIDTHGVDPGQDETFATNTQVLAQNGIILECLTNLDRLPAKGATVVIGLLRLKEGSGSPVSVMAFVP